MKIDLVGRPKRADVTSLGRGAAEIIDGNIQQLAVDVRAIVTALRKYRIDLSSDDDVTGVLSDDHLPPGGGPGPGGSGLSAAQVAARVAHGV